LRKIVAREHERLAVALASPEAKPSPKFGPAGWPLSLSKSRVAARGRVGRDRRLSEVEPEPLSGFGARKIPFGPPPAHKLDEVFVTTH
jgi:hypothetical protein